MGCDSRMKMWTGGAASAQKRLVLSAVIAIICAFGGGVAFAQSSLPGPSISPVGSVPGATPLQTRSPTYVPPGSGITDEAYRLGSGDKVRITVYGEQDLSGEFLVDASGNVQLPLVGQVKAAKLSIHEFIAEVRAALLDGYLKDPKVSVEVLNYRPFYILGEVNKPGEYPYESGLTIQSAVALAGGYTYRADDSDVYIRHRDSDKEVSVSARDTTIKINPGDIVRVPERLF